jgi:tetratricopeptide (TPR) repeat protein
VIQLLAYGKYHSSLQQTYFGLGEAYYKLEDNPRAHKCFQDALDISKRISSKPDEGFDLNIKIKLA